MIKLFSMLVLVVVLIPSAADTVTTKNGPLEIYPVNHAAMVLKWNGTTVYVDPYGGVARVAEYAKPDLILITDIHQDHMDISTLQALDTKGTTLVVPQAVADLLPEALKKECRVLANGEKTTAREIEIEAIPMYNLPETGDAMHPKGRGNGYVLTLGGKRIYISGDTEDIKEMRALKHIDVAFVCMNLPYTMDVDQAASAVLEFKPAIVYPYHYRGQNGLSDVHRFENLVNAGNSDIEVRLRNWYAGE